MLEKGKGWLGFGERERETVGPLLSSTPAGAMRCVGNAAVGRSVATALVATEEGDDRERPGPHCAHLGPVARAFSFFLFFLFLFSFFPFVVLFNLGLFT